MRRAGVAHSGQGALVCVDCTRRVICAVVSSMAHASRRSSVASGNKRARTVVAGVEMKVGSSSHECCLWGNAGSVSHRHEGCYAWIYGYMRYNREGLYDIPEWHIT